MIVVAVGGLGSIRGSLLAAIVLGVSDAAGKYMSHPGRLSHLSGDGQPAAVAAFGSVRAAVVRAAMIVP